MQNNPEISIIIPLFNESESLLELTKTIQNALKKNNFNYEIIFIDDGSTDNSWISIKEIATKANNITGISFSKNYGKSQALHAGFEKAKGN
ncbi:MAG: glycosyltransferase, partial [Flavobacteriaceae bacterium]